METIKILAITQARTGSTRLPAKVLKEVSGHTLLEIHLKRILRSKLIDQVLIATTTEAGDEAIVKIADTLQLPSFRGSTYDVLERFYKAARPYHPEWVVRITSDCPLIDPEVIDNVIDLAMKSNVDYCSNTLE